MGRAKANENAASRPATERAGPRATKGGLSMNTKQFVVGIVVATVILFALGYVIWSMLFADFFAANGGGAIGVDRPEQIVWAVVVGTLAYGLLLTLGLKSRSRPDSIAEGVKVGAIVGLLVWGTADFILFGVTDMSNLTATVADTLLEGVRGAISGAGVAVAVGMLK